MPYTVGRMIFPDWFRGYFGGGCYSDTFVIAISSQNGLPPDDYANLIRQFGSPLIRLRESASLWVQVDAPGLWYPREVRGRLLGMTPPYAVTTCRSGLGLPDFDRIPFNMKMPRPPYVKPWDIPLGDSALSCARVLARLGSGLATEIASLAGLEDVQAREALEDLEHKCYLYHMPAGGHHPRHTDPHPYSDTQPYWKITKLGIISALRSWGLPPGFRASMRFESYRKAGFRHQHVARMWPAWLRKALPYAEIWSGWSEVYLPEAHAIPDGLAWGRFENRETLFWLEVESGHRSSERLRRVIGKRYWAATNYCVRRHMRLVFALLAMPWVQEVCRLAFFDMHPDVAVVIGDWKDFGHLPVIHWGRVRQM